MLGPVHRAIECDGERRDHDQRREIFGERKSFAVELKHVADAGCYDQQLSDDDADQCAADRDAQAGENVGQRRRQHHDVQNFALGTAERARDLDQKTVGLLGAGLDREQLRKHRRDEDEHDQRRLADAEPGDEQRQPGDIGNRPEHENVRIEDARRGPENAEEQAERRANHKGDAQPDGERPDGLTRGADQFARGGQLDKRRGDLGRRRQNDRRHVHAHDLPDGNEHDRRQRGQNVVVRGQRGEARFPVASGGRREPIGGLRHSSSLMLCQAMLRKCANSGSARAS